MSVDFKFDRKALTEFEEFMTSKLQTETEKTYARTLRALGAGTVRHVKKRIEGREEHKQMLEAGVDYDPKKTGRIEQLDPMRIAIGVNDARKRRMRDKKGMASKPFTIKFQNLDGKWVKALAQRRTKERYPLHVIIAGEKNIRSMQVFRYLVDEYISNNHDKIFDRQLKQAIKRADK